MVKVLGERVFVVGPSRAEYKNKAKSYNWQLVFGGFCHSNVFLRGAFSCNQGHLGENKFQHGIRKTHNSNSSLVSYGSARPKKMSN